jgi:hypothetical protein
VAKGQQRSTREIRKPKKDKTEQKPVHSFGNKADVVANMSAGAAKGKPRQA